MTYGYIHFLRTSSNLTHQVVALMGLRLLGTALPARGGSPVRCLPAHWGLGWGPWPSDVPSALLKRLAPKRLVYLLFALSDFAHHPGLLFATRLAPRAPCWSYVNFASTRSSPEASQ
jgi:hypothetical protein